MYVTPGRGGGVGGGGRGSYKIFDRGEPPMLSTHITYDTATLRKYVYPITRQQQKGYPIVWHILINLGWIIVRMNERNT